MAVEHGMNDGIKTLEHGMRNDGIKTLEHGMNDGIKTWPWSTQVTRL